VAYGEITRRLLLLYLPTRTILVLEKADTGQSQVTQLS
jgi:hypothetical protein